MFPEMRHLWLDYFGAGVANFSSLMQAQYDLMQAQYDFIKVARELFILLQKSEQGRQLFPSLVALLSRFCNHVVVEGVETQKKRGMVTQILAGAVQGYFLSLPQPFENFSELKSTL
ncbi:MAG: EAL domain-containing protein [Symbiopectobacterium sp.]